MLQNYFKTALRNLLRYPGYSAINIAGLTLGLTCCLLIFQYVAFEFGFDRFHENGDRLYRIAWTRAQNNGEPTTAATTGWALGPAFADEAPEVARYARLHPEYGAAIVSNPAAPDLTFEENQVYYVDPAFLEMFTFPLLDGEPGHALTEPGTILLSSSAARKYFGSKDPIGRSLDFRGWISGTFRVAGIFADVPAHSHLQFDLLLPMSDLLQRSAFNDPETGWSWMNFITYVELHPNADPDAAQRKFTEVLRRHRADEFRESNILASVRVQPLRDVHLNDSIFGPAALTGSYRTVYFFIAIGFITLLIALVNYVNLATARSLSRSREVGVRKVVGANRRQLITQFLGESAITNAAAIVLAVVAAITLRPSLNSLAGTSLSAAIWTDPRFWAAFAGTFLAATLLAGLYPAFVLSSFKPAAVLKAASARFGSGSWLRRGLVVLQFTASIVLLVGTLVVYRQVNFMRTMDLGIDLEQIVRVPAPRVLPDGTERADAVESFTQELSRLPAVRRTTTSFTVPGQGFAFQSTTRRATADPSTSIPISGTRIDSSFASFYGLKLVAGEGFANITLPVPDGEPVPVIPNETTIRALGFDGATDALGQELGGDNRFRIVGVFEDFNWSSAHQERENAIFLLGRGEPQISIKVATANLPQTISDIEMTYKRLFPNDPFRYAFVDEQFDQLYRNDRRFAALFSIFAGLAVAIACLGLFGLASFTTQQRTKEIGVRKVLGASVPGIVALLAKEFLLLVALAFVVAAPTAFVMMRRWLQDFAFRTDLSIWIFVIAGAGAIAIALLTVSYQSVKAAASDPVKSLRYE